MSISSRWHEGAAPDHRYWKCEAAAARLEVPGTVWAVGATVSSGERNRPGGRRSLVDAAGTVGAMSEKRLPYFHLERLDRHNSNIKKGGPA